jgi:hypothetical protein
VDVGSLLLDRVEDDLVDELDQRAVDLRRLLLADSSAAPSLESRIVSCSTPTSLAALRAAASNSLSAP